MCSHLKRNCLWAMGAAILSIFLLAGLSIAAVGDITISAPSSASPGAGFTSEIQADVGGTVLGTYAVTFTFNKDVLQITTVQGGATAEFSGAPTYSGIAAANANGQINIAAFQASLNSPKNLVSIFRIGFTVIGAPGSSSTLSMNVNDLADPDFNPISHQVIPATLTVDATPAVTTGPVSNYCRQQRRIGWKCHLGWGGKRNGPRGLLEHFPKSHHCERPYIRWHRNRRFYQQHHGTESWRHLLCESLCHKQHRNRIRRRAGIPDSRFARGFHNECLGHSVQLRQERRQCDR